jgi:hypothetical protein
MNNRLPPSFPQTGGNGHKVLPPRTTTVAVQPPKMSKRIVNAAADSVGRRPIAILAAAFVTGVFLGKWIKRS